MSCPTYRHYHYAVVPWRQAEIAQQDLEPAGSEFKRDTRTSFGKGERQFALPVFGQSGIYAGPHLGMLAIRCVRYGETVIPDKLAIADLSDDLVPVQSGPQRFSDEAA